MTRCPACGSTDLHRSQSRTLLERFRKRFTVERLHRCRECSWRGWGLETHQIQADKWTMEQERPDFAAVDAALHEDLRRQRENAVKEVTLESLPQTGASPAQPR